jgi:hypothetical protein
VGLRENGLAVDGHDQVVDGELAGSGAAGGEGHDDQPAVGLLKANA